MSKLILAMPKLLAATPVIAALYFGYMLFQSGRWEYGLGAGMLIAALPFGLYLRHRRTII